MQQVVLVILPLLAVIFTASSYKLVPHQTTRRQNIQEYDSQPAGNKDAGQKYGPINNSNEIDQALAKKTIEGVHSRRKRAVPMVLAAASRVGLKQLFGQVITGVQGSNISASAKNDISAAIHRSIIQFEKDNEQKKSTLDTKIKDIMSKMLTKNAQNMQNAATIDIIPSKGMSMGSIFAPSGVKIKTEYPRKIMIHDTESDNAFSYNKGLGNVLLNGCYRVSLDVSDPCYAAKRMLPKCQKMLESASFIGVGFDGRGDYSASSRKKSIIQRYCTRGGQYQGFAVPDSMTVHGVYDTQVKTMTFNGVEQYRSYLEQKAAVSSSRWMFSDAVTKAAGHVAGGMGALGTMGAGFSTDDSSSSSNGNSEARSDASGYQKSGFKQVYMSNLEVNVIRYEIFLDDVTNNDLNMDFLHDFVSLPESYFASGAPRKFQSFILRWGTHYIKSAKFGGQLKLIKTKEDTKHTSIDKFAAQAQNDYEAMFSTYTARMAQFSWKTQVFSSDLKASDSKSTGKESAQSSAKSKQQGQTKVEQNQYSNEVLMVEGGEQGIAALVSEMYTTGFKHELEEWLSSIPDYPKPFEFQMESIVQLCQNLKQLFPAGKTDFGCRNTILREEGTGRRYYLWSNNGSGLINDSSNIYEKRYCFTDQKELEDSMFKRCSALQRAISVYMEEGPIPSSDIHLSPGSPGCETNLMGFDDKKANLSKPSWNNMTSGKQMRIITDMPIDIRGVARAQQTLLVFYRKANKQWYVRSPGGTIHLYNGWNNGGSGDLSKRKISISGLVVTYDEKTGLLTVKHEDFLQSKKVLTHLPSSFHNRTVARAEFVSLLDVIQKHRNEFDAGTMPCNVVWSNAHRFDPGAKGGKCISFSAMSKGDIFVVFSVIPGDKTTWYYVQISPSGIAIYKGQRVVKFVGDREARSLGDPYLYETYFVCVEEILQDKIVMNTTITILMNTTITFGKLETQTGDGHVFAIYTDDKKNDNQPLRVRFFAFGNGEKSVSIADAHVMQTSATGKHICKGATMKFKGKCVESCHRECKGCYRPFHDDACRACRNLKFLLKDGYRCVSSCPNGYKPNSSNKICDPVCHPECKGCNHPDKDDSCHACRHVKSGSRCVKSCPDKSHLDNSSKKCIEVTTTTAKATTVTTTTVKTTTSATPHSDCCALSVTKSGVYNIGWLGQKTMQVYCDMDTDGGGWTVFQRRQDGTQDFYLNWRQYANGFGDRNREFWLGNDNIHALSTRDKYELRIDIGDWRGRTWYATYSNFSIGDANSAYRLNVGGTYKGTAGEELTSWHNGRKFTTRDRDHDTDRSLNCAVKHGSAWWYKDCFYVDLNSVYHQNGRAPAGTSSQITWYDKKYLKFTEMKMRPKPCSNAT